MAHNILNRKAENKPLIPLFYFSTFICTFLNIMKMGYQIVFISLQASWTSNEIHIHFFSQLFLQMAWEGDVGMFDVLCIEVHWASVPWLGLLSLWKDIHHNNRKDQQMPRNKVSSLLPDDVAYWSRRCWYGWDSSLHLCFQDRICEWGSACSYVSLLVLLSRG